MTITADDQQRVCLPDAKPHQTFAYEALANGKIILTAVAEPSGPSEPFPRGSLLDYITPERDAEQMQLLKGCSTQVGSE